MSAEFTGKSAGVGTEHLSDLQRKNYRKEKRRIEKKRKQKYKVNKVKETE